MAAISIDSSGAAPLAYGVRLPTALLARLTSSSSPSSTSAAAAPSLALEMISEHDAVLVVDGERHPLGRMAVNQRTDCFREVQGTAKLVGRVKETLTARTTALTGRTTAAAEAASVAKRARSTAAEEALVDVTALKRAKPMPPLRVRPVSGRDAASASAPTSSPTAASQSTSESASRRTVRRAEAPRSDLPKLESVQIATDQDFYRWKDTYIALWSEHQELHKRIVELHTQFLGFDERLRAAANGPDADAVVREAQAQFDEHYPMRDRYYALDDLLHGIVEAMRAYAAKRDR